MTHKKQQQLLEVDGETYHPFTRFNALGDSGVSWHIFNSDDGFYDVKIINELMKGVSGHLNTTKKG